MRNAVAQIQTHDLSLRTIRTPLQDLALYLQNALTQKLAAYMVGLSDGRDIGRYAREDRNPHPRQLAKLQALFELLNSTFKTEDPRIVQAWFLGVNPELDGQAPAKLLRESFDQELSRVRAAAEKFMDAGE